MNVKLIAIGLGTTILAIAGLAVCVPNAIWLKHSTLRINNTGKNTLAMAQVQVGQQTLEVSNLEPGEFQFRLLPQTSEGEIAIMVPPSYSLESLCHTYVEGKMFHIDVTIQDGKVIACDSSLPILSSLWIFKALI